MMPQPPEPSLEYFTGRRDPVSIYYRDEIEAYGKACRAQALADAAEVCSNEEWRNDGNEVAYLKAFNEGCKDCESAIRRLK